MVFQGQGAEKPHDAVPNRLTLHCIVRNSPEAVHCSQGQIVPETALPSELQLTVKSVAMVVVVRLHPSPQQLPPDAPAQPCSPGVHSAPHTPLVMLSSNLPSAVQRRWRAPVQVEAEPGVQSAKQVPWTMGWFSQRPAALHTLCTVPLQLVARGVHSAPQRRATIGSSAHCP